MGLFDGLFRRKQTDKEQQRKVIEEKQRNTVRFLLEEYDSRAEAYDGKIYFGKYDPNKKSELGSYKKSEREYGGVEVYSQSGLQIGHIDTDNQKIYLWIAAEYEYWKSYMATISPYLEPDKPKEFVIGIAQYYDGFIIDSNTRQTIAETTGNPVETAAALVCLIYDGDSNPYRHFFNEWKKNGR